MNIVENNTSMRRRLLRRPTLAETEQIARDCPADGLSVTVIVQAFAARLGAHAPLPIEPVSDAFAAGILSRKENGAS
jgi:hypothetical protein